MKKFLIGAAAAAAIIAPSVAVAETSGVVGVQYTSSEWDSFDWDNYGIEGAFNHSFGNGTFVQFDGAAGRTDVGFADFSSNYGALHYGLRNDTYALGGFVSFDELAGVSGVAFGVEGQYYLPNLVFNGSIARTNFDSFDVEMTTAAIDGSYFFTPNLSVTGLFAVSDDEFFGDDLTTWGLGGEYRFNESPISIELGYRQNEFDDEEITSWTIGFNLDLGTGSLYERATTGASLNGASRNHQTINVVAAP